MKIGLLTLFPELFGPFCKLGFVGKAIARGKLSVELADLREHGIGVHRSIDDTPYGGGSGMVMRVDCVVPAMEQLAERMGGAPCRVLLTPQGQQLDQALARELSAREQLLLVAGRYEGFDERIRDYVDLEISLGDFVMTGGEVAAMAVIEACVRSLPGVLGNEASPVEESFSTALGGLLEYPQYTRPAEFRGAGVPDVLKGGDHEKIAAWRRAQALERTRARRPELVPGAKRADD